MLPCACPGPGCTCERNTGRAAQGHRKAGEHQHGTGEDKEVTAKVQDHSNGAGLEVLCQKPQMRPSEPKQVLWDVPLTWSLTSGKTMAQEPPRSPGWPCRREVCCCRERAAFTAEPQPAPGTRPLLVCCITAGSGGSGVRCRWKVHILSFNQIKCICRLHNHLQALIVFFCLALH